MSCHLRAPSLLPCYFTNAKQINILGSRQHPAEKVALWCDIFFKLFFSEGQIAIFVSLQICILMMYDQYKFNLSIVCDM